MVTLHLSSLSKTRGKLLLFYLGLHTDRKIKSERIEDHIYLPHHYFLLHKSSGVASDVSSSSRPGTHSTLLVSPDRFRLQPK